MSLRAEREMGKTRKERIRDIRRNGPREKTVRLKIEFYQTATQSLSYS